MYKVLIRPLEINDSKISWEWRNNPEIWEYTGSKPNKVITYDIEKEWIEKVLNEKNSKRFAVLVDDVYVGNIQLTHIEPDETAQYHIFIGDISYWNKGIAKLASQQIIRYAKNVLNLKRIFLSVNSNHQKAIKLYQSLNFIIVSNSKEIVMELDLNNVLKPVVSIFVMVYNHENYIANSIDEFLNQKCNFDYDIVIGEDCSKDDSRKILLEYQKKYPGKFKLLLHNENIGANQNQIEVLQNCTGNYIAMCEGDDYWTDPYKLQKQVDFLEANPDYVLSFHKVKILKPDGSLVPDFITKVPDNYETQETLARLGNYIHTPSVVFRNLIIELPKEFSLSPIGDYFLYMLLSERGKIKYIEDEMAVYRYGVGVISTMNNFMIASNNVKMYSCMISCIKDVDVKSILMKRQEMIISQYGKSFELKDSIILKLPKILIYVKDKSLELIYNPKRALMKIKNKVLKKIKN